MCKKEIKILKEKIIIARESLQPEAMVYDGLVACTDLLHSFINFWEKEMDKQIKKVEKDVDENKKGKAKKDIKKLMKMDKKFDEELDECKTLKKKMKKKRG